MRGSTGKYPLASAWLSAPSEDTPEPTSIAPWPVEFAQPWFEPGAAILRVALSAGPDPNMKLAVISEQLEEGPRPLAERALRLFAGKARACKKGRQLSSGFYKLALPKAGTEIDVAGCGRVALVTEHRPEEFQARFSLPWTEAYDFKPDHEHDEEVTSVGLEISGDLDQEKFQRWLSRLLRERGQDIYRSKGVLSLRGKDERYIFQGVHMLFDYEAHRAWDGERRATQMVFIGRNLDRMELLRGLDRCRA